MELRCSLQCSQEGAIQNSAPKCKCTAQGGSGVFVCILGFRIVTPVQGTLQVVILILGLKVMIRNFHSFP